jgi:hypothetical protein
MARGQGSLRCTARIGVFVAGLVLALSLPAIALAANTATFSGAAPRGNTTVSKPTISVVVYDQYGVSGSTSFYMSLGGVSKPVTVTRYSGWGTRKFKLSYAVPDDLALGTYTVVTRVRDARHRLSTYTWTFTVTDGTPPVTTSNTVLNYIDSASIRLTATDVGGTGVLHTYYSLDGATQATYTTTLTVSAGIVSRLHSLEFWSVDVASNVEAHHTVLFFVQMTKKTFAQNHALPDLYCSTIAGCHGPDLTSIHSLATTTVAGFAYKSCAVCHNTNPDWPAPTADCTVCHGANGPHGVHATISSDTSPSCTATACHGTDALTIHTNCSQCHASSRAGVPEAIHAGGAFCETCHPTGYAAIHFTTTAPHVVPEGNTCVSAVCHSSANGITIHAPGLGCASCHAPGKIRSSLATCSTAVGCHPAGLNLHAPLPAAHQSGTGCAVGATGCHVVDVTTIHDPSASKCAACHNTGNLPAITKGTVCTKCHDISSIVASGTVPAHTGLAAHALGGGCFGNPTCHAYTDASAFHMGTPSGCSACHTGNRAATVALTPTWAARCALAGCHPNLDTFHDTLFADFAASSASGHNVNGTGTGAGVKTKFDGSQSGVKLTWESEIASASLNATWTVATGFPPAVRPVGITSVTIGQEGTVSTTWDFPTVNVFWAPGDPTAPAGARTDLTKDSVITCFDCHSGDASWFTGPHGASARWAIDARYPSDYSLAELTKQVVSDTGAVKYPAGIKMRSDLTTATQVYTDGRTVICAKCHDLENFQSGTTANCPLPLISTGGVSFSHGGDTFTPVNVAGTWRVYTDAAGHPVDGSTTATRTAQAWSMAATGTLNTGAIGASNTAHASHHQDQTDGSPQCVNCHIGVPHGWKRPRLLVNTGVAALFGLYENAVPADADPYLDPQHLGTARGNITTASVETFTMQGWKYVNGAWVAGSVMTSSTPGFMTYSSGRWSFNMMGYPWNRVGMLTLSAVDDHRLNAGGLVFASEGSINPTGTLVQNYITGAANWSEPSCQGCNDHTGEDGIRIIDAP